jgi:NADPH2:quinone reductase
LRLEELADLQPGPGEVVVQLRAVGVNPVDTYLRSGAQGYKPELPYTPGQDGAGIVVALGDGVTKRTSGERVYVAGSVSGTYAEQCVCKAQQVHPLPERLSFAQGAAVGVPYATAYRALFQRPRAEPGDWMLIHGASGGVGLAATQLAVAAGLKVIGTAGTPEGLRLVTQQGAASAVDHHESGYLDTLLALTEGRGFDVILEMLANANLGHDLRLLAHGGRVVVIGSRGSVEINPREAMSRDADILGMSLINVPEAQRLRIHAALGAGLVNGSLRPVVQAELPLSEVARAHREVIEARSLGKIVLLP